MTIFNKSQGKTLDNVDVYLSKPIIFSREILCPHFENDIKGKDQRLPSVNENEHQLP
jgi:hypothetical protein